MDRILRVIGWVLTLIVFVPVGVVLFVNSQLQRILIFIASCCCALISVLTGVNAIDKINNFIAKYGFGNVPKK